MASFQSYKLLENGEPAPEDEDDLPLEEVTVGKGKRRFLESTQTIKGLLEYGYQRTEELREQLPTRFRPFCNLSTSLVIVGIMLIVVLFLLVVNGFASSYAQEDVLQYIDPLIGLSPHLTLGIS